jgi:hydrogenase expression/formation protein HypE
MAHQFGKKLDLIHGRVDMTHGAGGKSMHQLIEELFFGAFGNEYLDQKNDQAIVPPVSGRLVFSTDSHVVSPLFFPGGDIGSLSIYGTINDVAVSGAEPLYLSASFILEEGFPLAELKKIADSMKKAQALTGVPVITGDTKVVEKGKGDGVFITTTGVGVIRDPRVQVSVTRVKPGDQILISGFMGDHGVAVLSKRQNLDFETSIQSDSAPLHELIREVIRVAPDIHCMRDPTRGGLGATLNEIAYAARVGMRIEEDQIPVRTEVAAACELLGIDPLNVANEGKVIVICSSEDRDAVLQAMRSHPLGRDAAWIGEVREDRDALVEIRSSLGGRRILHWLAGEQLPRIC